MEPKEWMQNKKTVLSNGKLDMLIEQVREEEDLLLLEMSKLEAYDYMVSKLNYLRRKNAGNCKEFNVMIRPGDICYIDFGQAYRCEIGYLHFGLILSIYNSKVFVVPLSGDMRKSSQYFGQAQKEHIFRIGRIPGLSKISSVYLNDAKWLNSARIIDVKAYISPDSDLFKEIKRRIMECI
ncbi:MAG: hypothetical protein HUJ53_00250 [Holdemanella sp.]|nr:hypothetical protein [Holdemanella sp.]